MSLEGDCEDCANRGFCLTVPVVPYDIPVEIELVITPEGTAATSWWTKEGDEVLSALGPAASGYEEVNKTPWCG